MRGPARLASRAAALAVAFALGMVVATMPGIAWADPDAGSESTSGTEGAPSPDHEPASAALAADVAPASATATEATTTTAEDAALEVSITADDGPTVTYGASGGARIGDAQAPVETESVPRRWVPGLRLAQVMSVGIELASAPAPAEPTYSHHNSGVAARGERAAPVPPAEPMVEFDPAPVPPRGEVVAHSVSVAPLQALPTPSVERIVAAPVHPGTESMSMPSALLSAASGLLAAALAPLVVSGPSSPADTPILWGVLAWARRQFGSQRSATASVATTTPAGAGPLTWNLQPDPVRRPVGVTASVDPDTGWVTGWILTENPDDERVSYSGTGPTAKGSVIVYEDASFLYKPSAEARAAAARSGGATDTFHIVVSGDRGDRAIPVTVDVLPAE